MQPTNPTSHETSAGIVVYRRTNEGPKFLLLYHGGRYWNFPKGHLEMIKPQNGEGAAVRESPFKAAVRETCEETGIKEADLRFKRGFKVHERYNFNKGKTRVSKTVIFYLAETRDRRVTISDEHEGYGWFKYKDALRLLNTYRENESVIKRAHNFISPKPAATSSEKQQSS